MVNVWLLCTSIVFDGTYILYMYAHVYFSWRHVAQLVRSKSLYVQVHVLESLELNEASNSHVHVGGEWHVSLN